MSGVHAAERAERRPRGQQLSPYHHERLSVCTNPCKIRSLPLDCHCNSGVNSQIQRGVNGSLCVPGRALAGSSSPPHRQRTAPPSRPRTAPPGRRGTSRCRWASSAHARRVRARSLGAETTPDNNHHTKYSRIIAGCCSVACAPVRYAVYPWVANVIQGSTASFEGYQITFSDH
jgi:hypothetical protein